MARDIQIETMLQEQREIYQSFQTNGTEVSSTVLFDILQTHIELMERILDKMPNRADSAGYLSVQMHDRKRDQPWRE
jgi:hypothetical protein